MSDVAGYTLPQPRTTDGVEERRLHILTVTAECIAEKGYDAVRLREVSRRAGVSIGLIQHYFDTRDELLQAALKHLSERLVMNFTVAGEAAPRAWDRIVALIDQLCAVPDLSAHSSMWVGFAAAVSTNPELKPELESVYTAWQTYVTEAIELGIATNDFAVSAPVDDLVAIMLAFFDGYEYDMATGLVPADAEALRRRAILLARSLLHPRDGAAVPAAATAAPGSE